MLPIARALRSLGITFGFPMSIGMNRHLSTLSLLHTIYGVVICFSGFAMVAFVALGMFLQSDLVMSDVTPPPEWLGTLFQTFGVALFLLVELWGTLVILSGRWIKRRKHRTASAVIAAFCLFRIPLGTALGVFTLVVLTDAATRAEYEGRPVTA